MHHAPDPPEDFETWEYDAIRATVAAFCRKTRLPVSIEEADLVQEALLHWHHHRATYKPDGGASPRTYLERLITRKLVDLWRGWNTARRGSGVLPASLESPDGQDSDASLGDFVPGPSRGDLDLRMDVLRTAARLTPRQIEVLRGLEKEVPVSELARHLNIARDTVYEELKRIRDVFNEAGLKDFLS